MSNSVRINTQLRKNEIQSEMLLLMPLYCTSRTGEGDTAIHLQPLSSIFLSAVINHNFKLKKKILINKLNRLSQVNFNITAHRSDNVLQNFLVLECLQVTINCVLRGDLVYVGQGYFLHAIRTWYYCCRVS